MPRIPFFSPGDSDGTGTDKRFWPHAALLARRSASGARYAAHVADQKCCHSCFGLRLRLFFAREEFRRLASLPRILSEKTSKEDFQCGYGDSGFAESSSRRGLRLPRPIRLPRYARTSKDAPGLSSVIRFHDRKRQKPLALLLAPDRDDFPVRGLSGDTIDRSESAAADVCILILRRTVRPASGWGGRCGVTGDRACDPCRLLRRKFAGRRIRAAAGPVAESRRSGCRIPPGGRDVRLPATGPAAIGAEGKSGNRSCDPADQFSTAMFSTGCCGTLSSGCDW